MTAGAASLAGCTGVFDQGGSGTTDGTPETGTTGTTAPENGTASPGNSPSLPVRDVGSQFEEFESLDHWYTLNNQGTISAVSEGAYRGEQSLQLKATPDDQFAAAFTSFSEPQDMSGKSLSLAVKVQSPDIAKLSVALLAPDTQNMVRMTRTFPGPVGAWVRSDMGTTLVRGEPDLGAVEEMRLVGRRRPGQDDPPIDLVVDDIRLADAPDTGNVTLTFDDTAASHYRTAFPLMEEYGFPGVEAVISDAVGRSDRLNLRMMREMSDAGWDMASHPYVGAQFLTEYTAEEQRSRIEENKQYLVEKGFDEGARHFLVPKNVVGPETMDIVAEVHETLYTFGGMPDGAPPTTNYYSSTISASNSDPLKEKIDYTATYGDHLTLTVPSIGTGRGQMSERDFEELLDYIDQAEVEVVTCSQALDNQSKG